MSTNEIVTANGGSYGTTTRARSIVSGPETPRLLSTPINSGEPYLNMSETLWPMKPEIEG